MSAKPRILLLADRPGWAYDRAARGLCAVLGDSFELSVRYVVDRPDLGRERFDLLHVFFWGETWHREAVPEVGRVVKEISSHRFSFREHGALSPAEMAARHLGDAGLWTCTSRRLERLFAPLGPVQWTPNGYDPTLFHAEGRRASGPLRFGWAGNAADPCKGLTELLLPAAGHDFEIVRAGGDIAAADMGAFYRDIDVLLIASRAEGEPLTLIEGMACGLWPIAVDVGIVPELVASPEDGRIVRRDPAAIRAALQWAACNPERVRAGGRANAARMRATRTWERVAPFWQLAFDRALRAGRDSPVEPAVDSNHERNLGLGVGQWPDRMGEALRLLHLLPGTRDGVLVDLGCGRQGLRELLPSGLRYLPVDRIARTEDTLVLDLAEAFPAGRYHVALALGLLEYLAEPGRLLDRLAAGTDHAIVSFNDCSDAGRSSRQHWRCRWDLARFEAELADRGLEVLVRREPADGERLYLLESRPAASLGTGSGGAEATTATGRTEAVPDPHESTPRPAVVVPATPRRDDVAVDPGARRLRLALFSAAVRGDNSGDALIEDAVRRLLPEAEVLRLPLTHAPSEAELEQANACDLGVLCGTNLYQQVFACGLDARVLDRLDIPLLPLGVGGSAPIGEPIRMRAADQDLVRRLHERCTLASVRDPQSLAFVEGLGIRNVALTGCPVLFHGLAEPRFAERPEGEAQVSVRARLLHVGPGLEDKALACLATLARTRRPVLILQSPYDFAIAHVLGRRFGCELRFDPGFQVGPLVASARQAAATVGLRLHYGMLCLAYGRPAHFVGTDSRTASFCAMMGLPHLNLADVDPATLPALCAAPLADPRGFISRWRELARSMVGVLAANGLGSRIQLDTTIGSPAEVGA